MDSLKKKNRILCYGFSIMCIVMSVSACTFMGLDLQQQHQHETTILDPNINMSAWEFINRPLEDTVRSFDRFVDAVVYAGLEQEYQKPDRTFFVFNNFTILRYNANGTVNSACYFARNPVPQKDDNGDVILDENGSPMMRPARAWSEYPVEHVRNLLLYHMAEGEYSYHNLGPDNTVVQSLSPNPEANLLYLRVGNDRDSKIVVNEYPGTFRRILARTANLKATNGYVHVFDNTFIDGF